MYYHQTSELKIKFARHATYTIKFHDVGSKSGFRSTVHAEFGDNTVL